MSMKKTSLNKKKQLILLSVVLTHIHGSQDISVSYKILREIVPQSAINALQEITDKILDIMPDEAKSFYVNGRIPLLEICVLYSNDGEYSLEVNSATAILQIFNNDLEKIISLLDDAITIE